MLHCLPRSRSPHVTGSQLHCLKSYICLCTTHQGMHWGVGVSRATFMLNLDAGWRSVISITLRPIYPRYTFSGRLCGPHRVWTLAEEINILKLSGLEPSTLQSLALSLHKLRCPGSQAVSRICYPLDTNLPLATLRAEQSIQSPHIVFSNLPLQHCQYQEYLLAEGVKAAGA